MHRAFRAVISLAFCQLGLPYLFSSSSQISHQQLEKQIEDATADGRSKWEARRYADALKSYVRAEEAAHRAGDADHDAKAWLSICNCNYHLAALSTAIKACETSSRLAAVAGNKGWAGGAAENLGEIYRTLGDYSLAEKELREAAELLEQSTWKELLAVTFAYLTDLSIEQGRLDEGIAFANRGIQICRQAKLLNLEAALWDVRGFALLQAKKLAEADDALKKARAIRINGKDNDWFPVILGHESELELRRGNYNEALRLNDQAFGHRNYNFDTVPPYYFVRIRGLILLGLNRKSEALGTFRRAVTLADSYRQMALPSDTTNTQTAVYLNEVYHDFAELAAEMAYERHDAELSRQALEAVAANRAASLREQLDVSLMADSGFSERYLQLLSEIKDEQARVTLGGNSPDDSAKLQSIRFELTKLEDQSLTVRTKKENYRFQNSLKGIQARLHPSEVLLSFCLGQSRSFLWAVTVNDVELHELPRRAEIEQRAKRFSEGLENGATDESAGLALSETLFGSLSPKVWQKRDWLITEDGVSAGLVPYSALPELKNTPHKQPLIQRRSVRVLPSELLLLRSDTARPLQRFVGVGDPIYNLADSRRPANIRFVDSAYTKGRTTLGRLAGSEREVRTAAELSGMPETQILTGREATGTALKTALEKTPALLHFAVHVVSPDGKPQEAALALSLTPDNMPELLTREAIAAYRVPGTLVILSGCASGQGKALPSAGLIGLGRAWLLAGASAVVVSKWPIPDDSGEFFSAFYDHLHKITAGSLAERAATALQEAQLDMQRSSGYRSSPSFWAAYSILSKE